MKGDDRKAVRFTVDRIAADWLTDGGQEKDWSRVMIEFASVGKWK